MTRSCQSPKCIITVAHTVHHMCMSCSPVLSSRWAATGRQKVSRHNGLGSTRISMRTSQRAWRRAALSRSVSCSGLMLPCSHTSKRTRTAAPAHRCPRAHTHTSHTATVNTVRLLKHPNLSSGCQSPLWRQSSGLQTDPAGGRCWRRRLWEPGRCRPEQEPAARSL